VGDAALSLTQVAFVGRDHAATSAWYKRVLGFVDAGSAAFAGAEPAESQNLGVPHMSVEVSWALDRNDFFQLEFFQYLEPDSRPRRADQRPSDVGYSMVTLHVSDFDGTIARLGSDGSAPSEVVGPAGDRRVCVHDPDGALLELAERELRPPGAAPSVRPEIGVAVASLRVSVPSLARASNFFVDALGLTPVDVRLHGPEHERMWGLEGARSEALVLAAGNAFLELVEYADPEPRGWPEGYRLSDFGIMNFALGSLTREPYRQTLARASAAGHRLGLEFEVPPHVAVTYVTSPDGFSVEVMHLGTEAHAGFGFVPSASGGG
jgi:catechol 2,3-dioxygenase-like lactoylglutathione lyase family enzyme